MNSSVVHSNPKQPNQVDLLVGKRMRAARKEAGFTQQSLAERLGMSFQQVQKYETGRNRISAGTLYEVAVLLEKPVSWFFEDASDLFSDKKYKASALYTDCLDAFQTLRKSKDLGFVLDFLKITARSQ